MADVVLFRGDQRKLFGADVPLQIVAAPTSYVEFATRLNEQFRELAGVDVYGRLSGPLVDLQCGLWLARAIVLREPEHHLEIIDASIDHYLEGLSR